jgi:lipid-binding SYLF domain-containing protein
MRRSTYAVAPFGAALLIGTVAASAADYPQTIAMFANTAQSAAFFDNSFGYAVFPAVGRGSFIVGAAHGDGRVFAQGVWIGSTSLTQLSLGLQAGGKSYSEIIFFKDQQALDAFESGNLRIGAGVSAAAITFGASASADTTGSRRASASSDQGNARVSGAYCNGIAVFTIVREGLEGGASVQGERFSYHAGLARR